MTNMITQPSEHLQGLIRGFKTLHPRISYADIAQESGVAKNTVMAVANGHSTPRRSTPLAIENAIVRMAEREVAKKAFCDGANAAHYALIDDQIESAAGREKAELQTALADRLDQITALEQKLRKVSEQAQSSLADLTKANKRIAYQSENIETLQHEYTKAQTALTNSDKRITQTTQDKVKLSHERDRLQSRAEVFKITAFTLGALWLVTLFCLIVILVG